MVLIIDHTQDCEPSAVQTRHRNETWMKELARVLSLAAILPSWDRQDFEDFRLWLDICLLRQTLLSILQRESFLPDEERLLLAT